MAHRSRSRSRPLTVAVEAPARDLSRTPGKSEAAAQIAGPCVNPADLATRRRASAALEGRFDAEQLSADERILFDDLSGEYLGRVTAQEGRTFWAALDAQPNTDF